MRCRTRRRGVLLPPLLVLAAMGFPQPQLRAVQYLVNTSTPAAGEIHLNRALTVQQEMVTNRFTAYAQVEPVATLPIRVAQTGIVTGLKILPGATVETGQKLAELTGPEIESALAQIEAAERGAQTNLWVAQKTLAIAREQFTTRLVTRQMVLQAEAAVAQAQAACDTAQAQRRALQTTLTITAPVAGNVLAVTAADGQRVSAGETILTLQPRDQQWLKAVFYGADAAAIHVGMTGEFSSAGGNKPIPVKVVAVFGALNPDGGEAVGLAAAGPSPGWLNGEFGSVTLQGAVRSLIAVPTQALILDQGCWWVLVRTPQGDRPQPVTPGPSRGWQTFIESGLKPGDQVVVENAYLEFHRGISQNYQPPD